MADAVTSITMGGAIQKQGKLWEPTTFTLTHIERQDTIQRGPSELKTRNQRSLTLKCSLATVGGFQKGPCQSIQRATIHQHDTKRSWSISEIPGDCI